MKTPLRLRKISNYTLERINQKYNEAHGFAPDKTDHKATDVMLWAEEKGYFTRVPLDQEADDLLRQEINKFLNVQDDGYERGCPHCVARGAWLATKLIQEGTFTAEKLAETALGIKFDEVDEDPLS